MEVNVFKTFVIMGFLFGISESKVYTLDEVVSEALKNSNYIKAVEQEMQKTESQIQEVYGKALPSIGASFNISHAFVPNSSSNTTSNDNTTQSILDSIQGMITELLTQKNNSTTFNVTLAQRVFAQGKVLIGLKIANKYRSTLNCKLQEEKLKVKGAIIKLFFGALLSQKNFQIANESVKIAEELHRLVLIRQAIGNASELDTLTTRLHLKNAEIEFRRLDSELRMSYEKIMTNAGISEPVSTFGLDGSIPIKEFPISLQRVIELVKKNNYTLTQLSGSKEIQELRIKLAKSDYLPSIFAGASLGKTGQFDDPGENGKITWSDDNRVFLGVTWDIFTGSIRNQKLFQSVIDRNIFLLNEKQTIDSVVLAARNAYENVITSKDQLAASDEVIVLAEKGFSLAKVSYEVGSKTYLDMQNAELELHKAKTMNNAAYFNYNCAMIDLQILIGNLMY
jgi:outer membrane protein